MVDEDGYAPLARRQSKAAGIYVREDSLIGKMSDLKGKVVGLPSGTPVEIILKLTLQDQGFTPDIDIQFKDFRNVQGCLHKLRLQEVDACGSTSGEGVLMFQKRMKTALREVMTTVPFPHMLFVAHPRVPVEEQRMMSEALTGQSGNEQERKLKSALGDKAIYVPYLHKDYDVIRQYRQRWMENG